jgi:hypothetical protein
VKIRAIWPQSKIGINIGIILGSYWDHIGIILGSYWDHIGIILGSYWDHNGIILDKTFRPYQVVIFYIVFGKEVQHPKKTENPP